MMRYVPDLLVPRFLSAIEVAQLSILEKTLSGGFCAALSPPLHISHCIWLC
jgi:hypothetical protein